MNHMESNSGGGGILFRQDFFHKKEISLHSFIAYIKSNQLETNSDKKTFNYF